MNQMILEKKEKIIENLKQGKYTSYKLAPNSFLNLICNSTLDQTKENNQIIDIYLSLSHKSRGINTGIYQLKFYEKEITTEIKDVVENLLCYMNQLELGFQSDMIQPYKELLDQAKEADEIRYEKNFIRKKLQENMIPSVAMATFICGSVIEYKDKETLAKEIRESEDCGRKVEVTIYSDKNGNSITLDDLHMDDKYFVKGFLVSAPDLELRQEQIRGQQVVLTHDDNEMLQQIEDFFMSDFSWEQLEEINMGMKSGLLTEEILSYAKSEVTQEEMYNCRMEFTESQLNQQEGSTYGGMTL